MSTLTIKRPGVRKLVTPFLRLAVVAIVIIAYFTGVLCAQSTHASVADRVIDPSEGVSAGARVAAISTDRILHYAGSTN